ncbi:MAG TPA: DUF3078 domain-containing protein [Bacteroidia bacterium]|jgi:hypothetical protein|nr:DUF3078 domain-containing protein [Bacteroidia bacterium]
MKHFLPFLIFSLGFMPLMAQDTTSIVKKDTTYWKRGGVGNLSFAQSSFTNWAPGGQNSIAGTTAISLFANYKRGNSTWDNTLDMAYGKTELGNDRPRKTDDKIDLSSKYGQYAFKQHWYYSALFNFKSQFDKGYNYPNDSNVVSRFMAPGFFVIAMGMDYKVKDYFSVFIGPLTGKETVVNAQTLANAGAYGVTPATYDARGYIITYGKRHLEEFGGYFKMAYKQDIMKNVNFQTKVELFSNYLKNPQNVVVNWEAMLVMKVNKYIAASIATQVMYDDKVNTKILNSDGTVAQNGPRVQVKEVLGIGLSYKF